MSNALALEIDEAEELDAPSAQQRSNFKSSKISKSSKERSAYSSLHVIEGIKERSNKSFAIVCALILGMCMVAVLVLNMSASSGQYRLAAIKNQQKELLEENQNLAQEVEGNEVPQNLAAQATQLGMVPLDGSAYLNVETGKVVGNAEPALSDEKLDQNIAAPKVPYSQSADGTITNSISGYITPNDSAPPSVVTGGKVAAPEQQVSDINE